MALLLLSYVFQIDVLSGRSDGEAGPSLAIRAELSLSSQASLVDIADFSHIHNAFGERDPGTLRVLGSFIDVAAIASELIDLLLRIRLPFIRVLELHLDLLNDGHDVLKLADGSVRQLGRFLEPGLIRFCFGPGRDDAIARAMDHHGWLSVHVLVRAQVFLLVRVVRDWLLLLLRFLALFIVALHLRHFCLYFLGF